MRNLRKATVADVRYGLDGRYADHCAAARRTTTTRNAGSARRRRPVGAARCAWIVRSLVVILSMIVRLGTKSVNLLFPFHPGGGFAPPAAHIRAGRHGLRGHEHSEGQATMCRRDRRSCAHNVVAAPHRRREKWPSTRVGSARRAVCDLSTRRRCIRPGQQTRFRVRHIPPSSADQCVGNKLPTLPAPRQATAPALVAGDPSGPAGPHCRVHENT